MKKFKYVFWFLDGWTPLSCWEKMSELCKNQGANIIDAHLNEIADNVIFLVDKKLLDVPVFIEGGE